MQVQDPIESQLLAPEIGARRRAPLPERGAARLGRGVEGALRHVGEIATMLWTAVTALLSGSVSLRHLAREMHWMGAQSMPIITVTGVLSGIVTSQQGGYQFTGSVPLYILGNVVTSSIVLELGPVLTAVVFIGRVGARITAELGTMKVSEQIDALHSLGRHPVRTLVAPRLFAGLIVLPLLVAYADSVGVFAAMITAEATLGLGKESFLYGARLYWHTFDLWYSVGKGAVFGFIIPLIAAHMGMRTYGGAEGVGRSTTTAVVWMIMAVLILDATFPMIFLR